MHFAIHLIKLTINIAIIVNNYKIPRGSVTKITMISKNSSANES